MEPYLGDIDITGYEVEASDGSVGKVDEVAHAGDADYIVIATGPLIFGGRTIVPGEAIVRIDPKEETIYIPYSKDQIGNAPEMEQEPIGTTYFEEVEAYYGRLPGDPKVDPKS